jgi:hypothetical protein
MILLSTKQEKMIVVCDMYVLLFCIKIQQSPKYIHNKYRPISHQAGLCREQAKGGWSYKKWVGKLSPTFNNFTTCTAGNPFNL